MRDQPASVPVGEPCLHCGNDRQPRRRGQGNTVFCVDSDACDWQVGQAERPAYRTLETDHLMSVSEANGRGVSWLASTAAQGFPTVLMRNATPVAAVVPMEAYYAFMAAVQPSANGDAQGVDDTPSSPGVVAQSAPCSSNGGTS